MAIRSPLRAALAAGLLLLSSCHEPGTGPVTVSAIGEPPRLLNPNLQALDPAAAFLAEAVAQGLVRFDAAGEIEPALAQSWIVSDDGLRYTFRIRRLAWTGGDRVTAEQVVSRLRAAISRASRNPLKPVLGAVEDIVAMTDEVLEISLRGPRPDFLQLLAQPEMAIVRDGAGTGPYGLAEQRDGAVRMSLQAAEDEESGTEPQAADVLLRGERGSRAVARFAEGQADLVTGGTVGDLPLARAAGTAAGTLVFDPAAGLFGLVFTARDGPLADPAVRRALAMAVDRQAIAAALDVPGLAPVTGLIPGRFDDLPSPARPDWAASPMPMRRELAARVIGQRGAEEPIRMRVAMPDGPGYRIVFAHLAYGWRLIGVEAERVPPTAEAELRFIDKVAPAALASWYLRHFACEAGPVCDPAADQAIEAARLTPNTAERRKQLALADQILTGLTPFIPLAAPVRWSLVSPRLTGFRPNRFARHPAIELIEARP